VLRRIDPVLALHRGAEEARARGSDTVRVVAQRGHTLAAWLGVREAAAGGASRVLVRRSGSPARRAALASALVLDVATWCTGPIATAAATWSASGGPAIFDHPMSCARARARSASARGLGLR
jgi:hypothetical protein